MSVKPLDFQMGIPRSMDAAKVRSDELQKNAALQQQQVLSAQDKAEDKLKQVYSRSKTEEVRINEKQRENDRRKEGRKKKDEEKEDRKEESGKKYSGTITANRIDIKI